MVLAAALTLPGSLRAGSYVVQPGDTLSGLAERFETTQAALLAANPHVASADVLWAGVELTIPSDASPDAEDSEGDSTAAAAPAPSLGNGVRLTHLVRLGDTLIAIADIYGTTASAILALNPSYTANRLIPGLVLVVVDTTRPAAVAPAPAPTPTPVPSPTGAPAPVATPVPSSGQPASSAPRVGDQLVALYRVVAGDTFSGIAARAGVSQPLLSQLNPHVDPDRLFVGETLFVPGVAGDSTRAPSAGASTASGSYVVAPGDSASGIADRFGIPFAVLAGANPSLDLSIIFVGQTLRVPAGKVVRVEATSGEGELATYVVRSGDFAEAIASLHGIDLSTLQRLNPGANLNLIGIGQELVVPNVDLPPPPPGTAPAGPAPGLTHTVQAGDTVSGIAAKFGLEASDLTGLNPGLNPNLISVGQTLQVPGTVAVPRVSITFSTDFGDSIEYVAAVVGVTPHTLLANNPGLSAGFIGFGTVLRVPAREGIIVEVRSGDTLRSIASQFGTSVEALVEAGDNGVTDPNGLIAGQEILIPIITPAFVWPAQGLLTDGFGECRTNDCGVRHRGTDIAQNGGAALAMADGVVTSVGGSYCCGLGFFLEIDYGNGWVSVYGHLNGPAWVVEGQTVSAGEPVAEVGTTGFSTGPHLHVELYHNEWLLDALNYLP